MNNINIGRVVLGGLLAGFILNVSEVLLNDLVLAVQLQEFFERTSIAPPGGSFVAVAVTLTFVMGIVLILVYALIRPRLGPGPKTAVIAGLIMWFATYLYSGLVNGIALGGAFKTLVITLVWGLFAYLIAAIAGAWVYKEA